MNAPATMRLMTAEETSPRVALHPGLQSAARSAG
jgi:hypothetical protein